MASMLWGRTLAAVHCCCDRCKPGCHHGRLHPWSLDLRPGGVGETTLPWLTLSIRWASIYLRWCYPFFGHSCFILFCWRGGSDDFIAWIMNDYDTGHDFKNDLYVLVWIFGQSNLRLVCNAPREFWIDLWLGSLFPCQARKTHTFNDAEHSSPQFGISFSFWRLTLYCMLSLLCLWSLE